MRKKRSMLCLAKQLLVQSPDRLRSFSLAAEPEGLLTPWRLVSTDRAVPDC